MIKTVRIRVDGKHDYNIDVIEDDHTISYKLFYSDANHWNFPNDFITEIVDSGSGLVLGELSDPNLDYSEAHELYILLAYIHKSANVVEKLEVEVFTTKEL